MSEIVQETAADKKVKSRWNSRKSKKTANDENLNTQVQGPRPHAAPAGYPVAKTKACVHVHDSTEVQVAPVKVETHAPEERSFTVPQATQASRELGKATASDSPEYVDAETPCGNVQAGEALIEQTEKEEELFLNTCCRCGETLMLVIDFGEDFVCEEAGSVCSCLAPETGAARQISSNSDAKSVDFPAPVREKDDVAPTALPLRIQLLQQVLAEELTVLDAANLFLSRGEKPPEPLELDACREDIQRRKKERKDREKSEAAYENAKANQKRQQRYVGGQLVDVQKGSKYLMEPKESAAEKAKTSISLFIQGSHRGGGNGAKEKKGPRS